MSPDVKNDLLYIEALVKYLECKVKVFNYPISPPLMNIFLLLMQFFSLTSSSHLTVLRGASFTT